MSGWRARRSRSPAGPVRRTPAAGKPSRPATDWANGRLCALHVEATGEDPETARIVVLAVVFVGGDARPDDVRLDLDPADSGDATADALRHAVNRLWSSGQAVIVFDAAFALTVLDRELRRRLGVGLAVTGPVVDPQVIDRILHGHRETRPLSEACAHHGVRHDGPTDPTANAVAAARLAWRLAKRYPAEVGHLSPADLHRVQIDCGSMTDTWPFRPYTVDGQRDPAVVTAIHRKIRTGWEAKLRADGPGPFRPELHIINDTPTLDPYFVSIRSLPNHLGHDDSFPIALMGVLANALAADRVVVAWEPRALLLATGHLGRPLPEPTGPHRTLVIADLVSGEVTGLRGHPYAAQRNVVTGLHPFSWGEPHPIDPRAEPLPDVIADLVRYWRGPIRTPQSEIMWRYDFGRMRFDLTVTPRPR